VDRGPHRRDRVSLGRGAQRTVRGDRARAANSRLSGDWKDDDYDVVADGAFFLWIYFFPRRDFLDFCSILKRTPLFPERIGYTVTPGAIAQSLRRRRETGSASWSREPGGSRAEKISSRTTPAALLDTSWLSTLACGDHEDRTPIHGYEATREAAMAAFAKSWRRE
jgi:hypothetical protein